MDIVKDSGERQEFAREKFCRSLEHAGASRDLVESVCRKVAGEIAHGATTRELSAKARDYLALEDIETAARYGLKRGIMALGPAGFLFEKYISAVLHEYGYKTRHNVVMQGQCVSHEVDVIAEDDTTHYLLELKYHNTHTIKTHIDVVMYAWARLEDIAPYEEMRERHAPSPRGQGPETQKQSVPSAKKHAMWLITNTKFTHMAIEYARCKGIKLTGWTYPSSQRYSDESNLQHLIEHKKLYPVTVLPAVNGYALEQCARHGLMFAKDLSNRSALDLVKQFDINPPVAERIIHETNELFHGR